MCRLFKYIILSRACEVNEGFIIGLCWIAICSGFIEKTRKHFFVAVFVVVLFGVIRSPRHVAFG